jgi:hypothetical protein
MQDLHQYHHAGKITGSLRLDEFGTPFYLKLIRASNVLYADTANESIALDVKHIRQARKDGAAYAKVECSDDGRVWIIGWQTWDTRSRPTPWSAGHGEQRMIRTRILRRHDSQNAVPSPQLALFAGEGR